MTGDPLWDRWSEVDALLERALDRPAPEREAFLAEACAGDPELRAVLSNLLALAAEDADEVLAPSSGLVEAAMGSPARGAGGGDPGAESLVGSLVGPYRLVRVLGKGGMGTVFLGERADGAFERRVAVKVLHRDLGTRAVLERFRLERQILASLQHPAVAHLLDGGMTDDGRPYLVMEYVEGVPIDEYARTSRLGVEARIRLIVQVCDAVEHAHRQLVVHRDLKPSNILVTPDGAVKLLDFGIAKILEPASGVGPEVTRAEARFVTPEYAAPEQLLGEPVSTQTDVFALAGLLYELLTGVRPYERRADESVLERMIRGDEPTAASAAVADRLSPVPGIETARLRRRLGGDVDAILLRALQTRPEARYASVAALRDELERHLDGRPVAARGDARWYRARRFVRRHRWPLTGAAAVFLVVAGSAVGLALQRDAVVRAAEEARREARTAQEVTDFLVDLFAAADPEAVRSDSLTVQALLARGAVRIDSLADQPQVQAELLETLGRVHTELGDYDAAVPLLERAVEARAGVGAPDSVQAASLVWLGEAHRKQRWWDRSVEVYRRALRAAGSAGRVRIDTHLGLASSFTFLEALDSAEVHFDAALGLLEAAGEPVDDVRLRLAAILRRKGDLEGAAAIYAEAIEARRRGRAESATDFAITLNNLAVVRRMQERYEEAYVLYRETLDTMQAILGRGHPQTLMIAGNLAHTLERMDRADEALALYAERAAAAAEAWPEGHWRRAEMLYNHGAALVDQDHFEAAVPILSEALEMGVAELGAYHGWNAVYRGWLALAAAKTGRGEAAETLFGWSWEGVESYDGLLDDTGMVRRLERLVQELDEKGLDEEAARYRASLVPEG